MLIVKDIIKRKRMNKGILIFILLLLGSALRSQSLHSEKIITVDGDTINLAVYSGKKIVFVVAPLFARDSLRIREVKKFQEKYKDSLQVIGIVSREDGYLDSNKSFVKSLYATTGTGIILSAPMYTRKAAGSNQSALMKWLTKKTINNFIDTDCQGIFQTFFINTNGKLYATLFPAIPLSSIIVKRTVELKH